MSVCVSVCVSVRACVCVKAKCVDVSARIAPKLHTRTKNLQPFHRGSPAWEQIAQKLQATHEGKSVSPRACLDRVLTLLKDHSREDGKLKKR